MRFRDSRERAPPHAPAAVGICVLLGVLGNATGTLLEIREIISLGAIHDDDDDDDVGTYVGVRYVVGSREGGG